MYSIFLLLLAVKCVWCSPILPAQNSASEIDFDFLVLAQFWPQASCVYFEDKGSKCDLPKDIGGWTIHGLWPSNRSKSPEYCNKSMPFNYSEIESLRPQLDQYWHYYDADGKPTDLWNHEWDRHGTCAYQMDSLRGEMKYFSTTLNIHSGLQTAQAFSKSGINPSSSTSFQREVYFKAIEDYYGKIPNVVCEYDKKLKKQLISQIYLCFDLELKHINCSYVQGSSSYFDSCPETEQIYYLPYNTEIAEVWEWKRESILFFIPENEN